MLRGKLETSFASSVKTNFLQHVCIVRTRRTILFCSRKIKCDVYAPTAAVPRSWVLPDSDEVSPFVTTLYRPTRLNRNFLSVQATFNRLTIEAWWKLLRVRLERKLVTRLAFPLSLYAVPVVHGSKAGNQRQSNYEQAPPIHRLHNIETYTSNCNHSPIRYRERYRHACFIAFGRQITR